MENTKKPIKQVYAIFLFPSSHVAIKAELATKKSYPTARLIPLPPEVSAGCGMVLRADLSEAEAVLQCLKDAYVEVEGCYKLEVIGVKREVEKLDLI